MSKDYAKPSTTRTHIAKEKKPSSILWLVTLLLTGGLLTGLYFLSSVQTPEPIPKTSERMQTAPSTDEKHNDKDKKKTQTEEFSFYKLLPNSSVKPSHANAYRPKGDGKQYEYLLQTGSFRNKSDAERQKARIAFQGMRAQISSISGKNGVWHRVQVGPFQSRSKMNKAIDKLVTLNIQPLEKKIPLPASN